MKKFLFLFPLPIILFALKLGFFPSAQIKLKPVDEKIYHSAFPYLGNTEDKVSVEKIRDFEALAGKKIVWVYFSNHWFYGIEFPKENIKTIISEGKIPFVRLMPWSDFYLEEPDYTYSLLDIIDGKFDPQLIQWAGSVKKVNFPVLIDFGVEMNGDWFPWSGYFYGGGEKKKYGDPNYPDGPEIFRDAYRHIIELFRKRGVKNVTWFIHYNGIPSPNEWWNKFKYYYPGDDYIDWVGLSIYGAITPDEETIKFSKIFESALSEIREFTNKPIAILEFGMVEKGNSEKSEWLKEAFDTILKHKDDVKAISYWHESWENDDGTISDLRIDSSEESLEVYREAIKNKIFTPIAYIEVEE